MQVAFELRDWMLAQKLIKEPDKTEPEKTYMLGSRRDEEEFVGVRVPIEGTIPKDVSSALQQVLEEKITTLAIQRRMNFRVIENYTHQSPTNGLVNSFPKELTGLSIISFEVPQPALP